MNNHNKLWERIREIRAELNRLVPNCNIFSSERAASSIEDHMATLQRLIMEWASIEEQMKKLEDDLEMSFEQFKELMGQTAENLRRMRLTVRHMHWQFGVNKLKEFDQLVTEINEARDGWLSSQC